MVQTVVTQRDVRANKISQCVTTHPAITTGTGNELICNL